MALCDLTQTTAGLASALALCNVKTLIAFQICGSALSLAYSDT